MAHEQSKSDPILASLEAKVAKWTAALESYKAAVALDGPASDVGLPTQGSYAKGAVLPAAPSGYRSDLPVGVFRDKTIKEAIEIYLAAGRRKQTNKEIAIGLQNGGIATTAVNFEATIATALGRMKDEGTVLRFPDGWDLASSYPDSLRNRLGKDTKPRRSANGRGKASRQPRKAAATKKVDRGEDLDKTQEILSFIRDRPGVSLGDLAAAASIMNLDVSRDYLRVVTKRLIKRGLIKLVEDLYVPIQPS